MTRKVVVLIAVFLLAIVSFAEKTIDRLGEMKYNIISPMREIQTLVLPTNFFEEPNLLLLAKNFFGGKMKNTYKASIPLHKPPRIKGEVSKEKLTDILNRNLDRYRAYARIAGENHADILVFPEFGLLPGNFTSKVKKDLLKSICEPLPQDFDGPDPEKHRIFHAASTMAKANRLVLVINLCTLHSQHENNIYVTDVVFDENGKYVTHYHKSHIFFKRIFSKPDEIKTVSFHSFGVEFGLIICFDLFWKNPKANLFKKGIKHYPYCYAMRWVGRMVARLWSWCGKIVVIGANLGKYVGIFQKGKEVKHDIMDDVYFGVVE